MIFRLFSAHGIRIMVLAISLVGFLSALLYQPPAEDRLWRAGKASWWDHPALDLGLTGWGYAPEQPISFSHKLHAGEYGLDCLYCHAGARVSQWAYVPPVQTCVGCHARPTESPEVKKIQKYWRDKEPIPWVRVHALPSFTRFNHKRHVAAGVECQSCHGEVQRMDRVEQVSSLKMGWCVTCHEAHGASKDCLICHY